MRNDFKMVFLIVFPSNTPYFTLFLILVGCISHSVFPINLYKNKETASQPLSGKYIFSFVPYIVGKYSLLTGKRFSYFVGINSYNIRGIFSHNIWENRNYSLSSTRKRRRSYLTMRNTLKYYENKVNFKLK